MAKLIMTKGLPASGKSTWAREQEGFIVLEKDEIRKDLEKKGWTWSRENEKDVLILQEAILRTQLKKGTDMIAADTNFGKHEGRLKAIAEEFGADFEVKDFSDVPLAVCLERNATRYGTEKHVPEHVIRDMYKKFIEPNQEAKVEKVEWIEGLPTAVICDLDGTLAIHVSRGPYEEDRCDEDAVNQNINTVIEALWRAGHDLIFLSGRKDRVREKTEKWLDEKAGWKGAPLLMRKTEDNRNDAIVKNEIFDREIRGKYNVVCVLDDRDRVVKRWRELGLTCLQVNYGNF